MFFVVIVLHCETISNIKRFWKCFGCILPTLILSVLSPTTHWNQAVKIMRVKNSTIDRPTYAPVNQKTLSSQRFINRPITSVLRYAKKSGGIVTSAHLHSIAHAIALSNGGSVYTAMEAKMQWLLTFQVSSYCHLALQGSIVQLIAPFLPYTKESTITISTLVPTFDIAHLVVSRGFKEIGLTFLKACI